MSHIVEIILTKKTQPEVKDALGQVLIRCKDGAIRPPRWAITTYPDNFQGVGLFTIMEEDAKNLAAKNRCSLVFHDLDLAERSSYIRRNAMTSKKFNEALAYRDWLHQNIMETRENRNYAI